MPTRHTPLAKSLSTLGALAAVGLLIARAPAQQRWIVDENMAHAAHFHDLPTAVAAAAPRDTIVVYPGTYAPVRITKPLQLIGFGAERPRLWPGKLTIEGIAANDVVVVDGFVLTEPQGGLCEVEVIGNRGRVHLQRLEIGNGYQQGIGTLWIRDSAVVTVNQCWMHGAPAAAVERSRVHFGGCHLSGTSLIEGVPSRALDLADANVSLASTTAYGGHGRDNVPGHEGIRAFGGKLQIGASDVAGGTWRPASQGYATVRAPAIVANPCDLTADPGVLLNLDPADARHVTGTLRLAPIYCVAVDLAAARAGDALRVTIHALAGSQALLMLSSPAMPDGSFFLGELWLRMTPIALFQGVLAAASTDVPPIEVPQYEASGRVFALQALIVPPPGKGPIALSLPAVIVL
jgi:hypothetical protein